MKYEDIKGHLKIMKIIHSANAQPDKIRTLNKENLHLVLKSLVQSKIVNEGLYEQWLKDFDFETKLKF